MDYGKSGSVKPGRKTPQHREHNARGTDKNPYGARADKTELLARMKAEAEARKKKP